MILQWTWLGGQREALRNFSRENLTFPPWNFCAETPQSILHKALPQSVTEVAWHPPTWDWESIRAMVNLASALWPLFSVWRPTLLWGDPNGESTEHCVYGDHCDIATVITLDIHQKASYQCALHHSPHMWFITNMHWPWSPQNKNKLYEINSMNSIIANMNPLLTYKHLLSSKINLNTDFLLKDWFSLCSLGWLRTCM